MRLTRDSLRRGMARATGACLACALVPALLVTAGCGKKAEKAGPRGIPVHTEKATERDVPVYIRTFGTMVAVGNVDVMPQVSGKLEESCFKEGEKVSAGQTLFTIDARSYKADVDKAQAGLESDMADLKLKKATLDRNSKLVGKNLISKEDFETYQAQCDAAEAKVKVSRAALESAQINLGYCTITSSVDAVTGKRLVDPGNIVEANSTKLVNLRKVSPLYVDFSVSEEELSRIREARAKGTLDVNFAPERDLMRIMKKAEGKAGGERDAVVKEYLDYMYDAQLVFMDNAVGDKTGMIALRAVVTNRVEDFWPGQFVRLGLIVDTRKNAVLVPGVAVQAGKQGTYVFAVNSEGKADLRIIKRGPTWTDMVVVDAGVKVGETIVTSGQLGLFPGAPVMQLPPASAQQQGKAPEAGGKSEGGDKAGGKAEGEKAAEGK